MIFILNLINKKNLLWCINLIKEKILAIFKNITFGVIIMPPNEKTAKDIQKASIAI